MDKVGKVLFAVLFFVCLIDVPYGYSQFVRFAGLVGFAVLAYQAHQKNRHTEMVVYGVLALLFQPFFKIALGRQMWNIVDVIVGFGLIISIWIKPQKQSR